jgi:hypothetical protein
VNAPVQEARSSGKAREPGADRDPAGGPEVDSDDDNRWVCRTCRNPIANRSAMFGSGRPEVFSNPHGLVYEIITVREARGLLGVGGVVAEFSWFPGHAWQVVCCSNCLTHLGWHYRAAAPGLTPSEFFGLLVNELTEDGG